MKHLLFVIFCFAGFLSVQAQVPQNFKEYKLSNGLTVVLDRDDSQIEVQGVVAVNVGSQDEDLDATGLAHYLEHMLFKGTTILGTTDWEKEKPHIEKTYALYDELQTATSEEEIKRIYKQIGEATQAASKYSIPNELSKLVQQMGGVGLNASTSFDVTEYHNTFPPNQLERWLDLYSHRFKDPVFRLFQPELEVVYEEKNMSDDNLYNAYRVEYMKAAFSGHPYGRPIIGFTEHIKKPWMSRMREFYEKWYVPNNMVLVISGNFNMEQAEKLIAEKFGTWKSKPLPERNYPAIKPFKGKEVVKVKLTPYLVGSNTYRGTNNSLKEEMILDVVAELLSNSSQTGLLNKLTLDGDAMSASASASNLKDGGIFSIFFAPVFDINQKRQMSFKSVEKLINVELKKVKSGDFEEWLLEQVKSNMLKNYKLALESPSTRTSIFVDLFIRGKELKSFFNYEKELAPITKDDISRVANKYLGKDYLAFYSYKGEADKDQIEKPDIDPIKPIKHNPSEYAVKFLNIPTTKAEHCFVDMDKDVKQVPFQDKIDLYYVPNKRNDVFSMRISFQAGTEQLPKLEYAIDLMNNAGIMAQYKPDELRKEFGKLGVTYNFSVSENFTSISMKGNESKLGEACQLLSRLMLLPKVEDKALNRIIGSEYQNRMIGSKMPKVQFAALKEYIKYGDKSSYIDRMSFEDLLNISPTSLAGELNKALSYNANIHYYGKMPLNKVTNILKQNLAFGADRKTGEFKTKSEKEYDKNLVYLINSPKSKQSQIYLFVNGETISLEQQALVNSFNQYFSGSFNGLMMKEVREYRSLAYGAGARYTSRLIPSWKSSFIGQVGTQSDKTIDAIDVVVGLFNDMPEYTERINSIKDYLLNSSYLNRPSDRYLSINTYYWKLKGYKEDPTKFNLKFYKNLKFDDIVAFYKNKIKGKNIVIGIVGNINKTDRKLLSKYGKVVKIRSQNLFSQDK